jgi:hypothetical protein
MRKLLLSGLLPAPVVGTAQAAEVVVKSPHRGPLSSVAASSCRNHVWIGGYHRWDGHAYAWLPDAAPPRHLQVGCSPVCSPPRRVCVCGRALAVDQG